MKGKQPTSLVDLYADVVSSFPMQDHENALILLRNLYRAQQKVDVNQALENYDIFHKAGKKLVEHLSQPSTVNINTLNQSMQTCGLVFGQMISFKAQHNPAWRLIINTLLENKAENQVFEQYIKIEDELTQTLLKALNNCNLGANNNESEVSQYSRLCLLKGILVNVNLISISQESNLLVNSFILIKDYISHSNSDPQIKILSLNCLELLLQCIVDNIKNVDSVTSTLSNIRSDLIDLILIHINDPIENIDKKCSTIFELVVTIYNQLSDNSMLTNLRSLVVDKKSWSTKGHYLLLHSLISAMDISYLDLKDLSYRTLLFMGEKHLCSVATSCIKEMITLIKKHNLNYRELLLEGTLEVLKMNASSLDRERGFNVCQHIIMELLDSFPTSLNDFISIFNNQSNNIRDNYQLEYILLILKMAKDTSSNKKETKSVYNDFSIPIIQEGIFSADTTVKIAALELLCHHKNMQVVDSVELDLIELFFKYQMQSEHQQYIQCFLQSIDKYLSHLLKCLLHSKKSSSMERFSNNLQKFMDNSAQTILYSVYPGCPSFHRSISIPLLDKIIVFCIEANSISKNINIPNCLLDLDATNILIHNMIDSFSKNTVEQSVNILCNLPVLLSIEKVIKLLEWGKKLISFSIYNGEAGARLISLVYQKYLILDEFKEVSYSDVVLTQCIGENSALERFLNSIVKELQDFTGNIPVNHEDISTDQAHNIQTILYGRLLTLSYLLTCSVSKSLSTKFQSFFLMSLFPVLNTVNELSITLLNKFIYNQLVQEEDSDEQSELENLTDWQVLPVLSSILVILCQNYNLTKESMLRAISLFIRILCIVRHSGVIEKCSKLFEHFVSHALVKNENLKYLLEELSDLLWSNNQVNKDVGTRWEGTIFAILCVLRAHLFSSKPSDNIVTYDYVSGILNSISKNDTNKTSSLLLVLHMYKDHKLSQSVMTSYIPQGVLLALSCVENKEYEIRNIGTLLLNALFKKHIQTSPSTAQQFFNKHPSILANLKSKLTLNKDKSSSSSHFISLLFFSLFASKNISVESYDPQLLSLLIPYLSSTTYMIRQTAVNAVTSIIHSSNILLLLLDLLDSIILKKSQQNLIHSSLLLVNNLLQTFGCTVAQELLCKLERCIWLATEENSCPLTRSLYIRLIADIMTHLDFSSEFILRLFHVCRDVVFDNEKSKGGTLATLTEESSSYFLFKFTVKSQVNDFGAIVKHMLCAKNQAGKIFLQMLEENVSPLKQDSSYWMQVFTDSLSHNYYKEYVVSILLNLLEDPQHQPSTDLLDALWKLLVSILHKDSISNALFAKNSLLIMGKVVNQSLKQNTAKGVEYLSEWHSFLHTCITSTNPNLRLMSVEVLSRNIIYFTEFKNENITKECLVSIWLEFVTLLRDEEIDIKNFAALSLYKILHPNIKLNNASSTDFYYIIQYLFNFLCSNFVHVGTLEDFLIRELTNLEIKDTSIEFSEKDRGNYHIEEIMYVQTIGYHLQSMMEHKDCLLQTKLNTIAENTIVMYDTRFQLNKSQVYMFADSAPYYPTTFRNMQKLLLLQKCANQTKLIPNHPILKYYTTAEHLIVPAFGSVIK